MRRMYIPTLTFAEGDGLQFVNSRGTRSNEPLSVVVVVAAAWRRKGYLYIRGFKEPLTSARVD